MSSIFDDQFPLKIRYQEEDEEGNKELVIVKSVDEIISGRKFSVVEVKVND